MTCHNNKQRTHHRRWTSMKRYTLDFCEPPDFKRIAEFSSRFYRAIQHRNARVKSLNFKWGDRAASRKAREERQAKSPLARRAGLFDRFKKMLGMKRPESTAVQG